MIDRSDSTTRWTYLLALGVVLATAAAFVPALDNGFVNWDDTVLIVDNPHLRRLGWDQIRWMFTSFHLGPYQPLPWLTLAMDYRMGGLNPRGYHLTNVAWHIATALVFFVVARRILRATITDPSGQPTLRETCAAIAAVVFAVHPLRVESVVWVSERRDVLSGFFVLSSLWAYLRAVESNPPRKVGWMLLSLFLFLLSMLSKATGMCLPAVLSVLDFFPLRRLTWSRSGVIDRAARRVWLEKLPFWLLGVSGGLAALYGQRTAGAVTTVETYGPIDRLALAGFSSAFYVWKTLLPLQLSPLYEIPTKFSPWRIEFIVASAVSVGITAVAFRWGRPAGSAVWLSYLFLLAPVSGLAQTGGQLAADRYTYLPCLGFALLAGGTVFRNLLDRVKNGSSRTPAAFGLLLCLTALLGSLTWRQSKIWRDTATLWKHALTVDPDSSLAYNNAARAYIEQDRLIEAGRLLDQALKRRQNNADIHNNVAVVLRRLGAPYDAMRHYREAERLSPRSAEIQHNVGLLLAESELLDQIGFSSEEEQWRAALEHYRRSLSIKPDDLKTLIDLGIVQKKLGRVQDAVDTYESALKIDPDYVNLRYNLAIALAEQGLNDRATDEFATVLRLQPAHAGACNNLALLLTRARRDHEAITSLRSGLTASPDHPVLLFQLSWLMATSTDASARDGTEAVRLAERMRTVTGGQDVLAFDALAASNAELGRFEDAARASEQASNLAAQQGDVERAEQINARTELYRSKRPFRSPR